MPFIKKLSGHLDNLPGGSPFTESGVELKILLRLFTEEEAGIALRLTMKPESVARIGVRGVRTQFPITTQSAGG